MREQIQYAEVGVGVCVRVLVTEHVEHMRVRANCFQRQDVT